MLKKFLRNSVCNCHDKQNMVNFFFHLFSLLIEKVKKVVFEIYDLPVSFHFLPHKVNE